MYYRIMNAAVMPQPGKYELAEITKGEFVELVQQADRQGLLKSYIGYQQNVDLIKQWTGVEIANNREQTMLLDGDLMLIMRLTYRPKPGTKGRPVRESDFEFYSCEYTI